MTTLEIEQKISQAFSGGDIRTRDLRLTLEEADYVRNHYVHASLLPLSQGEVAWYQLTFPGVS